MYLKSFCSSFCSELLSNSLQLWLHQNECTFQKNHSLSMGGAHSWVEASVDSPPSAIRYSSTKHVLAPPLTSSAIQTQRCDRNARRNNLRFLHGTATYILFCFCFVSFACLFVCFLIYIKYNLAGYIITPRTMPSLYPLLIFIYLFSLHKKRQRRQETGKIPNCTGSARLKTPKLTCNLLKIKKAKEVYQLGFQVCRPWKSRVKN